MKFDLKLWIAEQVGYPLVVVSYDEKNPIGSTVALTVADGIVGQVVANRSMHEKIKQWLVEKPIESVPTWFRQDYAQDLVDSAGVQAELDWNPIARLASQYGYVISIHLRLSGFPRCEILHDPELPDLDHPDSFLASSESFSARIRAMKEAVRIGCRARFETPKGIFSETVWVRNITGPGLHPMGLAEDIAEVLVFKQVIEAYGLKEEDIVSLSEQPPRKS